MWAPAQSRAPGPFPILSKRPSGFYVSPIPVVAAGGILDGRGIAATLILGAVGVNLGTRFLASEEAPIDKKWKQAIAAARSEDAVKLKVFNDTAVAAHRRLWHRAALSTHAIHG
jgi:NAD(P)H-dependent flavin oxidoreductase YrpB (nitropropane dioxygenase family)